MIASPDPTGPARDRARSLILPGDRGARMRIRGRLASGSEVRRRLVVGPVNVA